MATAMTGDCGRHSTWPSGPEVFFRDRLVAEMETLIPHLRRYARSLTREVDEADDVVHDALVTALAKLHLFMPGTNLRAWLFKITRHAFVDRRRRDPHRSHLSLDEAAGDLEIAPPQESQIACTDLAAAYQALAAPHREVIALVVFEGMSYEDAADALQIAVGTVRSRLARARARLRSVIDHPDAVSSSRH